MTVDNLRDMKTGMVSLRQKKIQLVYLIMAVSIAFSLLVIGWIVAFTMVKYKPALPAGAKPADVVNYTSRFTIYGDDSSFLSKPMAVVVANDRIYVSDTGNNRIQVFTLAGETWTVFGSAGDEPGNFKFPYGLAVSPNGELFVADAQNGSISVFDKNGNFLRYFASREKQITQPAGMFFDGDNLYVCNLNPSYVLVLNSKDGQVQRIIGSPGTGPGQLSVPNDAVIGPDSNLYVSDTGNNRIQIYSQSGEFIQTMGINTGLLYSPRGIAFNSKGQLFVTSKLYNEVSVFDLSGKLLTSFGADMFHLPNGIAFDERGRLYISDINSVTVFD